MFINDDDDDESHSGGSSHVSVHVGQSSQAFRLNTGKNTRKSQRAEMSYIDTVLSREKVPVGVCTQEEDNDEDHSQQTDRSPTKKRKNVVEK